MRTKQNSKCMNKRAKETKSRSRRVKQSVNVGVGGLNILYGGRRAKQSVNVGV